MNCSYRDIDSSPHEQWLQQWRLTKSVAPWSLETVDLVVCNGKYVLPAILHIFNSIIFIIRTNPNDL
jgi:ABC-type metal ion transport system substrate-binding protein